jgi:hypothetical protein
LILAGCFLAACGVDAARAADERPRDQLGRALLAYRMRELGLLLSREAYAAHARMLDDQPAKQGVVLFYLGLVEAESGDVFRATDSFARAAGQLPPDSPLKPQAEAWKEGLASGKAPPFAGDGPPPWWWKRMAAASDSGWRDSPDATKSDFNAISTDERIDVLLALRNNPAARDVIAEIGESVSFTPRNRVWLRGLANTEDDVEYPLFDPGLWTALLANRTHLIESSLSQRDDLEAGLCLVWSRLLAGRTLEAESQLEQVASGAAFESGKESERSELACLGMVLAQRLQRPDRFQRWRSEILSESGGLSRGVSLWALRALDLADRQTGLRLEVGQASIRTATGGSDPFEPRLMFPRSLADRPAAEELRDYCFEVAWIYRALHREKHGAQLPATPDVTILSAERIMSTLASPLMRQTGTPWPLLRTLMHADVLCRTGDWESWQNHLSDRDARSEPAVGILRTLARGAAAAVRVRSTGDVRHRDDEQLPETVGMLLTSRNEFTRRQGEESPTRFEQEAAPADRSQWIRGVLWRLLSGSVLLAVGIMAGLAWWLRPGDAAPDELTATFASDATNGQAMLDSAEPEADDEWVIESPGQQTTLNPGMHENPAGPIDPARREESAS